MKTTYLPAVLAVASAQPLEGFLSQDSLRGFGGLNGAGQKSGLSGLLGGLLGKRAEADKAAKSAENDDDLFAPAYAAPVATVAPVVTDGRSNFYLNILDLIGLRLDRGLLAALLGGPERRMVKRSQGADANLDLDTLLQNLLTKHREGKRDLNANDNLLDKLQLNSLLGGLLKGTGSPVKRDVNLGLGLEKTLQGLLNGDQGALLGVLTGLLNAGNRQKRDVNVDLGLAQALGQLASGAMMDGLARDDEDDEVETETTEELGEDNKEKRDLNIDLGLEQTLNGLVANNQDAFSTLLEGLFMAEDDEDVKTTKDTEVTSKDTEAAPMDTEATTKETKKEKRETSVDLDIGKVLGNLLNQGPLDGLLKGAGQQSQQDQQDQQFQQDLRLGNLQLDQESEALALQANQAGRNEYLQQEQQLRQQAQAQAQAQARAQAIQRQQIQQQYGAGF
ncbi:hypothetical protein HIM_03349 [Hirsutella minnesotensis 3608]|uniref:Uncharacterized protein n=1 Tax=Hirsutella minnesotensis 3608 TaxID=1043627 RepID=A0A0F7ZVQ6_9HYPO|nr:hypothetical protein HIM_03349 [Hirsutella minnesotensis 3608]